jgi:hypothetical protein
MTRHTASALLLFFSASLITAPIVIHTMRDVAHFVRTVQGSVMVLFDIDNTLLEPVTDLGSDQWFCYLLQKNIDAGCDRSTALDKVLPLYFHVNYSIDLVPTEEHLAECIRDIQMTCDHVICLTARSFNLCEKTIHELGRHRFNFHIPEFALLDLLLPHPSIYRHGILFCGSSEKGEVLTSFLEAIHYKPDTIIFVDDKEKNLHMVEQAVQALGIHSVSFRYAGCDARVAAFEAYTTERELEQFLIAHPFA